MNATKHATETKQPSIFWKRIAVVLILAAPFAFAAGGFLILSATVLQQLAPMFEPLNSVLAGFASETLWQCTIFFGWLIVACLYPYFGDMCFKRASISLAFATVFITVAFAGILLHEQHRIARATAAAYLD